MGKLRSPRVQQLLMQTLEELAARPHARILDIGAGRVVDKNHRAGYHELADAYARLMRRQEYIALEIDASSAPAVVGDAHALPFPDAAFDAVLMVSVLEHLYDPLRAVDQVHRVLRPGGIFFSYAPFYHPYHGSPRDYFRLTLDGYAYALRNFSKVQFVSGGNYIAVLNDVLAYPLNRAGRAGRLAAVGIEFPLRLLFDRLDERGPARVAVGYGARACK